MSTHFLDIFNLLPLIGHFIYINFLSLTPNNYESIEVIYTLC